MRKKMKGGGGEARSGGTCIELKREEEEIIKK